MAPEFVTFHADRPKGADRVHPNANLRTENYMCMLDLLFRSVRLFNPGAKCVLLTDVATQVLGVTGKFARINSKVDHSKLMLSRSSAQLVYVEHCTFAAPLVLIDSDILLNAPISPVFTQDFDVALTWRISPTMPINGGLVILNNRRPQVARAFFRRFVDIYRERYVEQSAWFGDQLALRDCVGMRAEEMSDSMIITIGDCRVLLLPCETHNFSPENHFGAIEARLKNKVVLHFKGPRKRLMVPYWTSYLRPRESGSPWVHFQGWWERRRVRLLAQAERRAA